MAREARKGKLLVDAWLQTRRFGVDSPVNLKPKLFFQKRGWPLAVTWRPKGGIMPEILTLIVLLIEFIGTALWMNARPGPLPFVTFLATFVLGGFII